MKGNNREKNASKGYALNSAHKKMIHRSKKLLLPSNLIAFAKREIVTKNEAARIIQKHCRGVIARKYVRLVQARLNNGEMQRELNGIQMRSVMKIVSKMRLFVKRKRAERQKQRKMLAEIVVRKAKARNDRVSHQTKMLQSISEQAAKRALEMRQAKRFINNTDEVNHIDKHIKQTRKSVLLVKQSAVKQPFELSSKQI